MPPSRKKPRKEPPSVDSPPKAPPEASTLSTPKPTDLPTDDKSHVETRLEVASSPLKETESQSNPIKQVTSKSSWYGTWPRKSIPSTSVARKTVLADKPSNTSSADLGRFEPKKTPQTSAPRPPCMNIGKSRETLDITMAGTLEEEEENKAIPEPQQTQPPPENVGTGEGQPNAAEEASPERLREIPSEVAPLRPPSSSGWLGGWLSRPSMPPSEKQIKIDGEAKSSNSPITAEAQGASLETQPPAPTAEELIPQDVPDLEPVKLNQNPKPASNWFGFWPAAVPSAVVDAPIEQIPVKTIKDGQDTLMSDAPALEEPAQSMPTLAPAAGSSWAFWSTDTSKKPTGSTKQSEAGQLAVTGEVSQDHPEPAKTATVKESKKGKSVKRVRPASVEIEGNVLDATDSGTSTPKVSTSSSILSVKALPPNLLIPSVRSTYKLAESPGILQQISRLIMHSQQQPSKHVFLVKEAPKIKKALAIGIHGLFPAAILRTVIGQPTGTSIRFANHAAAAVRRWADKNGSGDCDIDKVALEGEGRISERVDNLWKLLLNWIDHVRKADFILIACHSQGVPVAMMLIAKLIEFGVVSTGKIGVCAMAGVSLGPFADYKSKLFSGSAGELFEFADPESNVSKRYEDSLRIAMHYGVRVMYCGSIDDQLVSMESAIFAPASHPYIYRSVFVDGRIHAPDFLSHLVGFALKLRNLGVPDHGLIRELSAPLAGSLYTGEGHSRLYDDGTVYDLAIEFALETTSVGDVPLKLQKYEIATNANPYVLPWIMRGLLEEDFVKTELDNETTELLKQFDDWKPATKVLKDVKYRLEAVRSKL